MFYVRIFCIFYCISIYTINSVECSKILCVFEAPVYAHQLVFRTLSEELLRKGHELVIITPLPTGKSMANLTEITVPDTKSDSWGDTINQWSSGKQDLNQQKKFIVQYGTALAIAQLKDKNVQKLIKDKSVHFDLILIEAGARMHLIFLHIFKAPLIIISSLGAAIDNFDIMGAVQHPLLYPPSMGRRFVNPTFWEKINEIYDFYLFKYQYTAQLKVEDDWLMIFFGENTPSIRELSNNVAMLILNTHKVWDGNRPVPPGVVYLGGLHQAPEKELPQDLKTYLDSSEHGVIYISFGTNVSPSLFATEKINMFINVLSNMSYDIIWKWKQDDLLTVPKNIRIFNWLPQADLLRHPKIKLFITQGGLQSTDEAITAGVPLIGIPMIGDQWYNTEKYLEFGIGKKLEFDSLTENLLKDAIKDVLENKSYRRNVVKLRSVMYDQPETSLERAVWWIEHVIRHGGAQHLRANGANVSWAEYFEIKIIFTVLLALLTIIILIISLLYYICRLAKMYVRRLEKKNK